MTPNELIKALIEQSGRSTMQVAKDISNASFQGTLHRVSTGETPTPTRATAKKIADHFKIPIEALYDKVLATQVAKERGLLKTQAPAAAPAPEANEQSAVWQLPATSPPVVSLSAAMLQRISRLTHDQVVSLESVMKAHLDAVAPETKSSKRASA